MALGSRLGYEPERSLGFASIGSTYAATGIIGAAFTHRIRMLVLQNTTNAAIQFSLDGTNTLITIQPSVSFILDITTNRTNDPQGLQIAMGWAIYAQYVSAPASGSLYISALYGTS